jgi:CheY-like chemotaxis protein/anti-sigma regulatory factor (Ser/Thr protein kinase)
LPEKQLENLDKVLVSAEHLLGLINTILDIAKIEAGRMELQLSDFNLAALVEGCLATSQPLAKPGVQLLSSLPPNLPQMHSDEEKIRQVLLNLVSNAAKFTHGGSIRVNGELKNGKISLAVQDTGIGIAPEDLGKIFEEFQQADNTTTREYGGTGLGLSISRSLAKLLGGDLTVTSVEGQGSTFTLTLPMHLGPAAAVTSDGKEEITAPSLDPDKPIVLVIDDQPDMFHILQQNLGDAGYQVVGALSGEEGIEKARSLHPFAITLDIMMPRKDGWQVLYELKNDPETKDIPIIILTIVDNKPMGFRLGASDYLVKPLSEKSVLDALQRLAKSNGGVRPRKLLVVDDDPKVFDMVQQMLDGEGFAIESAADGVEALTHLKGNQPDAILLDLLMPRMDGFQFIEELQKHPQLRAIPIIVLTAKSLSNEEQAQLENSVAKIIKKQGLGSETLIKEIRQIVSSPAENA